MNLIWNDKKLVKFISNAAITRYFAVNFNRRRHTRSRYYLISIEGARKYFYKKGLLYMYRYIIYFLRSFTGRNNLIYKIYIGIVRV